MKKLLVALAAFLVTPAFADCVLRQSDAVEIVLGPYVDSADGNTEETSLTISQGDVILKKCAAGGDCGASAQKNDSGACAHDANGFYECDLNATDTDTVGILEIWSHESGALPVKKTCEVLEEAVYDALKAASALGYVANAPVNAAQISGDSTAADNLETAFDGTAGSVAPLGILDQGTAQSATGTTIVLRAAAAFGDDTILSATVVACGSTQGYCQANKITDYVGATDTATVGTWGVTPSGTITYYVFASAPGSSLDAAGIRAAVGLASADLDTQLDPLPDIEAGVTTIQDGVNVKQMNDADVCGTGAPGDLWTGCP